MLTVEDFFVTTVSNEQKGINRPSKLIMSDKRALFLPPDMSAVHLEHAEYFFDSHIQLPSKSPHNHLSRSQIHLSFQFL